VLFLLLQCDSLAFPRARLTAIGFAYSPYGDEEVKLEVQPDTTKNPNSKCTDTMTCPAPMYFLNERFLGQYSNIAQIKSLTVGEVDFGLDVYEPMFFRSPHEWTAMGTFNIKFRFDDEDVQNDLFYFCHIHEFMGGRIKLTKNGEILHERNSPSLGYKYDFDTDGSSDFDIKCGTFGLAKYQLPNAMCPDQFVCGVDETDQALQDFSACIDAMNCAMMRYVANHTESCVDTSLVTTPSNYVPVHRLLILQWHDDGCQGSFRESSLSSSNDSSPCKRCKYGKGSSQDWIVGMR
jgi:hypothetical protein